MKSPYDARQERERDNAGRIQHLIDAAEHMTVDPRKAPPFFVYPGEVAKAAGIESYTYQEIQFVVQRMQAAGWVAAYHSDQRSGDYIELREPNPPLDIVPELRPRYPIPGRD